MCQIVLSIPDEILYDTKMNKETSKSVCKTSLFS